MNILTFAAIDIGSNAFRLLIMNVIEGDKKPVFKKISLVRVPVRLGHDVFLHKRISESMAEKLLKTIIAYKHLIDVHEVAAYRACATSAMREAENRGQIVKTIEEKTGVRIEIIDGEKEAEIIYSNQTPKMLNGNGNYLYVDVGGGSTQITLFSKNSMEKTQSFNIGTVRMIEKMVDEREWDSMKIWLKKISDKHKPLQLIGSGGNINLLLKLAGSTKKNDKFISIEQLDKINQYLSSFSYDERVIHLELNPDRADVIIPATSIFLSIMDWTASKKVFVPQTGISDGIIRQLYREFKKSSNDSRPEP